MGGKTLNKELLKELCNTPYIANLYILTCANLTNTRINHCHFGDIPLLDYVVKVYNRCDAYKYNKTTQSLIFDSSRHNTLAVVIPQVCTECFPDDTRCYYGRLTEWVDNCEITSTNIHKTQPFRTEVDWKNSVPLSRFSYFYTFNYKYRTNIIIGDEEISDIGQPIWIDN